MLRKLVHKTIDEWTGTILGIFLLLVSFSLIYAAPITAARDVLERAKVSTPTNHSIAFTTPTGAAEGSTITVTFPSAFGSGGMTENDIDILDDGVPLTTAPDCTATEQASAVWSGSTVLTITICAGDGGAIAGGSIVNIRIGTNAITSGAGVTRLTNPASAGSYRIDIGGTFSDTGATPVAITIDDQISVSANVGGIPVPPTPPPATPAGGTGNAYNTPPIISNITVDQITTGSVRVNWVTDEPANSYVDYGLTSDFGRTVSAGELASDHHVLLSGLGAGLTYYFRVRSADYDGNMAVSETQTFTTVPISDTTAPVISNVIVEYVTPTEAKIIWRTNEPAHDELDYGRDTHYGAGVVMNAAYRTSHDGLIVGLTPDTRYHFRIKAIDGAGNSALSGDYSFTTFDDIPPIVSDIHVEDITTTSAVVVWTTNEPTRGRVEYRTVHGGESGSVFELGTAFTRPHRAIISNLQPATGYEVRIFATDAFGNDGTGGPITFNTLPDVTAPTNLRALTATPGDRQILLTWRNPPENDFAGVRLRRDVTTYPLNPESGVLIYEGNEMRFLDTGLTNGTRYYYTGFAYDTSLNFASGSIVSAIPATGTPPSAPPAVPPTKPEEAERIDPADLIVFVDKVPSQIVNGILTVPSESEIELVLPASLSQKPIEFARFTIGGNEYLLRADKNGAYRATITAPTTFGRYDSALFITYKDGSGYASWFTVVSGGRPGIGAVAVVPLGIIASFLVIFFILWRKIRRRRHK